MKGHAFLLQRNSPSKGGSCSLLFPAESAHSPRRPSHRHHGRASGARAQRASEAAAIRPVRPIAIGAEAIEGENTAAHDLGGRHTVGLLRKVRSVPETTVIGVKGGWTLEVVLPHLFFSLNVFRQIVKTIVAS